MSQTECKHGNSVVDEICGYCWVEVNSDLEASRDAFENLRAQLAASESARARLREALMEIHAMRLECDGANCACGECSQCTARAALAADGEGKL